MCASNEIVVLACAAVVLVAPGLRDCSLVPTGICNALLTSTALVLAALMQRISYAYCIFKGLASHNV